MTQNRIISIENLPPEISLEVAQEFIEYRQAMGKRYALKTQGAFDRQMKIALRAHEVGMTPDELITWTIDQNWQGINISYTKNRINQIMQAECNATRTKDIPVHRQLTDTSWARHSQAGSGEVRTSTRKRTLIEDLTDTSWS